MSLIIGSHVSFLSSSQLLGSVNEALLYGANTFMFYTGSNHSSNRSEIDDEITTKAHILMQENNINIENVMVHAPFIINFANNKDERKYNFYISFMKQEIQRCKKLGVKNLIFHPGSRTDLSDSQALSNIVYAIDSVMDSVEDFTLIVEFMSGKGSEVGGNLTEISYIINNSKFKDKLGICLDTCHMNDAGIDLKTFNSFLDELDKKIGISKLKCIHINDSLNIVGFKKDRHANIGYGTIGFDVLMDVIYNKRISDIPKILETPYVNETPPYKHEINSIKAKKFSDFISNL